MFLQNVRFNFPGPNFGLMPKTCIFECLAILGLKPLGRDTVFMPKNLYFLLMPKTFIFECLALWRGNWLSTGCQLVVNWAFLRMLRAKLKMSTGMGLGGTLGFEASCRKPLFLTHAENLYF